MKIIDSQVHAYAANTPERPWLRKSHDWPDHVTADEMVKAMDVVGVDGAINVSPASLYGPDDSYARELQQKYPGRFVIVKPVDTEDPAVDDIVAEWKRVPGTVAVRVMLSVHFGKDPNAPGVPRALRAAARNGLPVNLQCGGSLDTAFRLIDAHPETRFAIDHMGFYQPRTRPAPPDVWKDLPQVLELARRPNAAIKVSGACTMSQQAYPYDDIWDPLARIFDAWGFERCMWGTDWTRTFPLLSYQQGVDSFRLSKRITDSERAMLMGGACAQFYGWQPAR